MSRQCPNFEHVNPRLSNQGGGGGYPYYSGGGYYSSHSTSRIVVAAFKVEGRLQGVLNPRPAEAPKPIKLSTSIRVSNSVDFYK